MKSDTLPGGRGGQLAGRIKYELGVRYLKENIYFEQNGIKSQTSYSYLVKHLSVYNTV